MKAIRYLTVAALLLPLAGCFDVELEVPVLTQVSTVAGNPALHKAKTVLHGEILQPARVTSNFGLPDRRLAEVYLAAFQVQVTSDALAGPNDLDDLTFVSSMVIYVRSLDEEAGLPDVAVAWYYADEQETVDGQRLVFDVDPDLDLHAYLETGFELYSRCVSTVPDDDVSVEGLATFSAIPEA